MMQMTERETEAQTVYVAYQGHSWTANERLSWDWTPGRLAQQRIDHGLALSSCPAFMPTGINNKGPILGLQNHCR